MKCWMCQENKSIKGGLEWYSDGELKRKYDLCEGCLNIIIANMQEYKEIRYKFDNDGYCWMCGNKNDGEFGEFVCEEEVYELCGWCRNAIYNDLKRFRNKIRKERRAK